MADSVEGHCCVALRGYHVAMSHAITLSFRPAVVADVPAIVPLVESAYRGESGLRGWTTESHLLDGQRTDPPAVAAIIEAPDSMVLLAESNGALQACCQLERQERAGYFGMFAVVPTLQGAGIGKAVLAEAERFAREVWGCEAMRMTVIEQRDELIQWYERRGYRLTGEHEPFPYGQERFGIPRRDDLRFVVLSKLLTVAA
ncbi:N-acetyltransferase [Dyella sp. GSA-30]|nr:N-acetyltransferase [Dyella sp. GSA-30]